MKMGAALALWLVCGIGLVSSGCVMKEQYEAEKTRALNFQRLLAQEEKRTGELDAEAKRLKRDLPELEAKNRELTAQLQAVREQAGRIKEENDALRESTAIKAREEMNRSLDAKPKSRLKAMPKVSPSNSTRPALPAELEPAMRSPTPQPDDRRQGGYRIGKPPPGERSDRAIRRRRSRGLRSRASTRL